jgi:hypothetical protein
MGSVSSINRYNRGGTIPVHVFFDHRRTRSTVRMKTPYNVYSFKVPRAAAVSLQARLAANPGDEGAVLTAFVGRWRQP